MKLVLIRHGETVSNLTKSYAGSTNEKLVDSSKEILRMRYLNGDYPEPDLLFSSPMKRCTETAKILYPNEKPIFIDDFQEMNFGDFEGKNYKELADNPYYKRWIESNGTMQIPNGESKEFFEARVNVGLKELIRYCRFQCKMSSDGKCVHEDGSVTYGDNMTSVAVVHGGTIMAIMELLGKGDYFDFQVANSDFVEVDITITETDFYAGK